MLSPISRLENYVRLATSYSFSLASASTCIPLFLFAAGDVCKVGCARRNPCCKAMADNITREEGEADCFLKFAQYAADVRVRLKAQG